METATTFPTGQLVSTRTVNDLSAVSTPFAKFVWLCISRHKHQDWGDCCKEDSQANDQVLKSGGRIFSVYLLPEELQYVHRDTKIWIITEADRSVTTALFPSEY